MREEFKTTGWSLVVIDEAHELRNAYRPSNKVGQGIRWATQDCRKLLLTATPLQNSLLELYGLSTLIDERLFGDVSSFRSQYGSAGSSLEALRHRLSVFCKRTLRNVVEYVPRWAPKTGQYDQLVILAGFDPPIEGTFNFARNRCSPSSEKPTGSTGSEPAGAATPFSPRRTAPADRLPAPGAPRTGVIELSVCYRFEGRNPQ